MSDMQIHTNHQAARMRERMATPLLSTKHSCMMSLLLACFILFGLFTFRSLFKQHPIVGGFLASIVFVLEIVAVGNFEKILLGSDYQVELLPEVITCLIITMVMACFLSPISCTTCLLFSSLHIYFINQLVQPHDSSNPATISITRLKKRNKLKQRDMRTQ